MNNCLNCCKQYFCKIKDLRVRLNPIKCKDFISWSKTKNFGEVVKKNNS